MKLLIKSQVPAAKNRHIISMRGSRPLLLPNKQYAEWKEEAAWQLKGKGMVVDYPVALTCVFFVKDHRGRDLDNMLSAVLDALVKAEIIRSDSWQDVRPITIDCGGVDKNNPRVEIWLDEA